MSNSKSRRLGERGCWLAAASLVVFGPQAMSAADGISTAGSSQLQRDFSVATGLVVEPDWHDLPPDAARFIEHIGKGLMGAKPGLANIGEAWSVGDDEQPGVFSGQHLFSAYSDTVTASVFLIGGYEPTAYALLARRHSDSYCIFKIRPFALTNLRIEVVQDLFRPDRGRTSGPVPKCQPQSLKYALQLASPVG